MYHRPCSARGSLTPVVTHQQASVPLQPILPQREPRRRPFRLPVHRLVLLTGALPHAAIAGAPA